MRIVPSLAPRIATTMQPSKPQFGHFDDDDLDYYDSGIPILKGSSESGDDDHFARQAVTEKDVPLRGLSQDLLFEVSAAQQYAKVVKGIDKLELTPEAIEFLKRKYQGKLYFLERTDLQKAFSTAIHNSQSGAKKCVITEKDLQ